MKTGKAPNLPEVHRLRRMTMEPHLLTPGTCVHAIVSPMLLDIPRSKRKIARKTAEGRMRGQMTDPVWKGQVDR
ncbi:hypothetical protein BA20089_08425 [Bifidobacterium asteroides DSM 20089]|uniref:Uncharacterized protein n=1 Tax=Bifidobacterium asteroides DSM 20089 TaxID=1437594 RepID=A0AAD0AB06_9BIFI|nr:hypothetical protein BA20089_08425 [Bifidobacterium asteroides DSM 20089]PXY88703.1 hypothetical protein DKK68_00555 [Bifidobacterium asteroides]